MKGDEAQAFLHALGTFTRSNVAHALKTPPNPHSPATIVAACAWLSSMDPGSPMVPHEHFIDPLETLAGSKHASAALALKLIAEKAANARIRVEAIRRLGRVSAKVEVRKLLHSLVAGQSPSAAGFQGETINDDEFKRAAIQAIGDMAKPTAADTDVVLGVLNASVETRSDSALFRAAAEALCRLAKPANLDYLVDAAVKLADLPMALDVLSICAKYARRALLGASDRLSDALARSLQHLPRKEGLRGPLCNLARGLSCAQLLTALSSRYSDATPHTPIGAVVWAAVEAYQRADETLTDACLALVRGGPNADPGGPCFRQLKRCAEAGYEDRITRRIARLDGPGYKHILENGSLRDVLGGADQVVDAVCRAFTQEADVRDPHAFAAMRCILALGIADGHNLPPADWLASRRSERDGRTDRVQQVADQLRASEAALRPVRRLAQCVYSDSTQKGAIEIAARFTAQDDGLAHLFLEVLLATAANVGPAAWEPMTSTLSFRRFEDGLFPHCEQWLKQHVADFLVQDDRLNRYVLDFIRRRNMRFLEAARTAAQCVGRVDDADYLLEQVARPQDHNSARTLADLTCYAAEDRQLALHVRKKAIRLIGDMGAGEAPLPEQLRGDVLPKIHARFNDALEVRLAAYAACLHIADFSSIVPLVQRRETESDSRGKTSIEKALTEMRQTLLKVQPDLRVAADCVTWIRHMRDLGDTSMAAEIGRYLDPPHPDEKVVVAALECLGCLGGQAALQIVDNFVRDTAPEGEIRRAARRTKIALQDRKDVRLFEVLSRFFPEDSDVLDPAISYDTLLGVRTHRLAAKLEDTRAQWDAGHWDDFVTHLDAACDLLVKNLFERAKGVMGLDQNRLQVLAKQLYGGRVNLSEFRAKFPVLQAAFAEIHALRDESTTAHAEDRDGTEKPGLTETEAKLAMEQFLHVFPRYVAELRGVLADGGGAAPAQGMLRTPENTEVT